MIHGGQTRGQTGPSRHFRRAVQPSRFETTKTAVTRILATIPAARETPDSTRGAIMQVVRFIDPDWLVEIERTRSLKARWPNRTHPAANYPKPKFITNSQCGPSQTSIPSLALESNRLRNRERNQLTPYSAIL